MSQDSLLFDQSSGKILTSVKSLSPKGELELTFDEWIQAWHRLLILIKRYLPHEYNNWHSHYSSILNNSTRAMRWLLWLTYDTEVRRRSVSESIDPSVHQLLIWNELEPSYIAKMVKEEMSKSSVSMPENSRNYTNNFRAQTNSYQSYRDSPDNGYSFRNQKTGNNSFRAGFRQDQNFRQLKCIFCGDCSKSHSSGSRCDRNTLINGNPCHLFKNSASETRRDKKGKNYCYSWNGLRGCQYSNCTRGEHLCSLCGSQAHNAQSCRLV